MSNQNNWHAWLRAYDTEIEAFARRLDWGEAPEWEAVVAFNEVCTKRNQLMLQIHRQITCLTKHRVIPPTENNMRVAHKPEPMWANGNGKHA